MKITLKTALKWAGIDLGNPVKLLQTLIPIVGMSAIQSEAESYLFHQVTPQRRAELVTDLRTMADQVEKQQNLMAAKTFVKLLQGIKF
jgi:hypothetical protein